MAPAAVASQTSGGTFIATNHGQQRAATRGEVSVFWTRLGVLGAHSRSPKGDQPAPVMETVRCRPLLPYLEREAPFACTFDLPEVSVQQRSRWKARRKSGEKMV